MDAEELNKRRKTLMRHIDNVRDNCVLLGERLIEKGEVQLGHNLIANGYCHDNSKFAGVEWEGLHQAVKDNNPDMFKWAAIHHTQTNKHHPEAWNGIENMCRLYLAEMVCDWAARSSEFGNDLREWIKDHALKKYNFKVQSKTYKTIKEFVDLLLDTPFKG